jgi:hypothetical protein
MTADERKNCLEALHSLRFDSLPDAALSFLKQYLLSPSATSKVSYLIEETARLHAREECDTPYYEHVTYPGADSDQEKNR